MATDENILLMKEKLEDLQKQFIRHRLTQAIRKANEQPRPNEMVEFWVSEVRESLQGASYNHTAASEKCDLLEDEVEAMTRRFGWLS